MRIPDKYQVFPDKVQLTHKDLTRLGPHLHGLNQLTRLLPLEPTEDDLKKMVVIEVMDKGRPYIIERLLPQIERRQRATVLKKIAACKSDGR